MFCRDRIFGSLILPMETKQDGGDGDPTDEAAEEELYVSDISAELEPIIELVGE